MNKEFLCDGQSCLEKQAATRSSDEYSRGKQQLSDIRGYSQMVSGDLEH